ncbi:GntR family transcriptional regulator [Aquibacillus sp. 3ASR75-11]|uniref:GntR family transcriptional regulator n=1 Tax=Terrihalobacillus insolitus TaxID=2950438 RepID=A0A9X3WQV3_9BACI|nr:GntR family transcriptional regulator [Terrihalobacillus insolitus]MDC3424217.1 GntR family transcriptional regulator [Terrihalobacillus insolitus]
MSTTSNMLNTTDKAYTYIKKKIMNGDYKPSEKLVESQLATDIGVSRNTIRNALVILQKENLIEMEKNKGAKIKAFTLEEINNYLEIRLALEGVIGRSVAANISDDSIEQLEQILQEMEDLISKKKYDDYSKLNKKFHRVIYESAKNQQAVQMVLVIKTQLLRFHLRTILVPGRSDSSLKEHTEILTALKERDQDRAEKALKEHISHVKETINNYYQFLI